MNDAAATAGGDTGDRLTRLMLRLGQAAAAAAAVLGAVVTLGWLAGPDGAPGWLLSMFPTTSLCLALSGIALLLVWRGELAGRREVAVRVLGALVVLATGSALVRAATDRWPTIEVLITELRGPQVIETTVAPPNSALSLLLVGLMLLLFDTTWRGRHPARFFVLPAVTVAFLGLVGGFYDAEALSRIQHYAAMPKQTAVGVLLIGMSAFLSRPDRRFSSLFVMPGAVGDVVRLLVPVVILLPIAVGLLVLAGLDLDLYDPRMALAIYTLASVATLLVIVLVTADRLRRVETLRLRAEAELRRLNAFLTRQAVDLAAANKELEAFSYSVSHDLRAPLRSIDGFSLALLEDHGRVLDEEAHDYLRRVRLASQRMGELIDSLLNLSRLSRAPLQYETVNLSRLVEEKAGQLRQDEPSRDAEFVIAHGLTVRGDQRLLRALIDNLMENAWKFTGAHERTRIEFGAAYQDGERAYFVKDNGVGFDMAYSEKLFVAFQRLHRVDEFEGMGIGLATCLRVVRRHGGRMWAEGVVDQGATFYFTLGG